MDSEFEKKLRHQPVKKIPSAWRAEFLAAAHNEKTAPPAAPIAHRSLLSTIHHQLSTFFWPHPKAWAGLAAVWIFIFMLNFSMREKSLDVAEKSSPPSPEVIVELKKQQRLFAELMGAREEPVADRAKIFVPHPRSGRTEWLVG